mmetsp:Transcript_111386/g.215671  ORF Transcript_111386/g.215671 Transcript_111386/m.215671 type:complete len:91 (+) Transcript_111386:502-774(+)
MCVIGEETKMPACATLPRLTSSRQSLLYWWFIAQQRLATSTAQKQQVNGPTDQDLLCFALRCISSTASSTVDTCENPKVEQKSELSKVWL